MYDIPLILEDYLNYMETIKGASPNTTKEYFFDLRTFFRFLKRRYKLVDKDTPFEEIDISDVDIDFIKKIGIQDLHAFISYADKERHNSNSTKFRKVASLKSFFDYLYSKIDVISENPADKLEFPKTDIRQPVYLTLDECEKLLNTVLENKNNTFRKRDYAIIILFLNCGLRLSELSSINLNKIKDDIANISDEKLMYILFEKLTNIEKDIDEKEFCDMMLFPPNNICSQIREGLYKSFVALMKGVKSKFQVSYNNTKEINNVLNDFPEDIKNKMLELPKQKTDEEKLAEIKEKIKETKDDIEQQKLILEAWKLQEKINKKLNNNKEENK